MYTSHVVKIRQMLSRKAKGLIACYLLSSFHKNEGRNCFRLFFDENFFIVDAFRYDSENVSTMGKTNFQSLAFTFWVPYPVKKT